LINNVAPGVFFYWIQVTGPGTFTITQTPTPSFAPFAMASGTALYTANCTAVNGASITQNSTTGTVTVTVTGSGTFFIGIKYDATSVKGQSDPGTTVVYAFNTQKNGGANLTTDQDISLVKKGK
jgi:hypothetical protein